MSLSESDILVLKLAERRARKEELPQDARSQRALRRCQLKGHVHFAPMTGPEPPAKVVVKRWRDVKPGDRIQISLSSGRKCFTVSSTRTTGRIKGVPGFQDSETMQVLGDGYPMIVNADDAVAVFDGPIPQPERWTEIHLTGSGELELLSECKQPTLKKGDGAFAVEALLGEDGKKILAIAHSERSADDRAIEICRTHPERFLVWKSAQWAGLLRVSAPAIRKGRFWKEYRLKALEALRDERH